MRIYYETFHLHRLIPNSVTNTALVASRKEYQSEESFNPFWLMVISGFYFSIDFVVSLVIDLPNSLISSTSLSRQNVYNCYLLFFEFPVDLGLIFHLIFP